MAGRIRDSDIEELRSRVNIADVIGEQVQLKTAGVGSLKGLCPFHDERSPSFHVRPQVGRYHCFGCGEGGDVFTFLQKTDLVTFVEAVERLASRIGFALTYENGGPARDTANRVRLLEANRAAAEFFTEQLEAPQSGVGREFLDQRGFDRIAAERFGMGFAPAGWDGLTKHLRGRGFSDEELTTAGLVSAGGRGVYDRFRGRVVWPIRDLSGETVGFGARRLLEEDKGPKYLNTPETPIYHKSQVLYGLDLAKREIGRNRRVVIVEGYTDVMACHLAGEQTAVATCGTSFGVDHIKVLRRVLGDDSSSLGEVIFTFDPDAAGQKAAVRAFGEESRFAAQTYVAVAPDGLDPADLRQQRGDEAVRRLVETKRPMFEFMIKQILNGHDLDAVEGRVAALRAAAPLVADIRDPSLRPGYTRELARWLGTDLAEVRVAVDRAGRAGRGRREEPRAAPAPRVAPAESPGEEPAPAALPPVRLRALGTSLGVRVERDALMAVLQHPDRIEEELRDRIVRAGFAEASLSAVRDAIGAELASLGSPDRVARVAAHLPEHLRPLVEELAVAPLPTPRNPDMLTPALNEYVVTQIVADLDRLQRELRGQLQRTDYDADPERWRGLQLRFQGIETDKRLLREAIAG